MTAKKQIYQDIWVNGEVLVKGVRDCAGRYEPIQSLCKKYTRPFTILDIGANLGYFSFRLASEFNCVSVMIERDAEYQKELLNLIEKQNNKERLILLGSSLDVETLKMLGECEHFDIILALRVVHHFKTDPFNQVINAIISQGDYTFLELPTTSEDGVCSKLRIQHELADHDALLQNYDYHKIDEYSIHVGAGKSPMYLIHQPKKEIAKAFYWSPNYVRHFVESDFASKKLVKRESTLKRAGTLERSWVAGINLFTYTCLSGLYPTRQQIARWLVNYSLPDSRVLTDIRPWNFILGGSRIQLIDYDSLLTPSGKPFKQTNARNDLYTTALFVLLKLKNHSYFPKLSGRNRNSVKARLILRLVIRILSTTIHYSKTIRYFLRQIIMVIFSDFYLKISKDVQ